MTISIGLIGAGGIAQRHAAVIAGIDGCRIAAVVDPRLGAADELAARHGGVAFDHLSPAALDLMDAAYVLTPPRERLEVISTLIDREIPIFCEKPLSATATDARAIARLTAASKVPFMMGFMRRWHPPYATLVNRIRSGELGSLTQLARTRIGRVRLDAANWRVTADQQVGITVESLSHDLDLLMWIGGPIDGIDGAVLASDPERPGFDDTAVATLRFESGAIGTLHVSWSSDVALNHLVTVGTQGSVALRGRDLWDSSERATSGPEGTRWTVLDPEEAHDDGYRGENETFVSLLRGGSPDHPSVLDGLRTLELSEQLLARAGAIRLPGERGE